MKPSQVLSLLATFTALAGYAVAAPTEADVGAVSAVHRINQVEAGKRFKHGAIDLARALRKYGAAPDENIASAEKLALTKGTVAADPQQFDSEYLSPVKLGGQTFHLDFDTGSSDLWTFSAQQPAAQTAGRGAVYKCTNRKLPGESWMIRYGDGSKAKGNIVRDSVTVGGITVAKQAIECATDVSGSFIRDKNSDGIFGLGFNRVNTARPRQVRTWFSNAKKNLNAPVFTAYLKHQAPGSYDFGFIDAGKHSGSIAYQSINPINGYWQFNSGGFAVGSGNTIQSGFSIVADTGTSLVLTSTNIAAAYYRHVNGAMFNSQVGGYIFPCSAKLPSFSILAGGRKHTTPGKFVNYAFAGTLNGQRVCYGGIQRNGGLPFTVLGDVFLKSQFVVFDASRPRIGFAAQA